MQGNAFGQFSSVGGTNSVTKEGMQMQKKSATIEVLGRVS
jgi:hypothetical protein